jgi:hypothetical protein
MAALAYWPSVLELLLEHCADATIAYWDEPAIDRVRRAAKDEEDPDRRASLNTILTQMQAAPG